MPRPSRSTTRLVFPAHPEFFPSLRQSVRFHLGLFGIRRPAAAYALAALEEILAQAASGKSGRRKVRLTLQASDKRLRLRVRLTEGNPARRPSRLPPAPAGIALHPGKSGGDAFTLDAAIPERA